MRSLILQPFGKIPVLGDPELGITIFESRSILRCDCLPLTQPLRWPQQRLDIVGSAVHQLASIAAIHAVTMIQLQSALPMLTLSSCVTSSACAWRAE